MAFNLKYKPYGERSILIEWPSIVDEKVLFDVLSFKEKIRNSTIELIINVNTAYNSILITYKFLNFNLNKSINKLKDLYLQKETYNKSACKQWRIPVCYDDFFAIDLDDMASAKNCSKEAIIKRHSQMSYTVYCVGFLPGFLYLGGLDGTLFTPRKATPRLKVEKGAIAIGGKQTGVYPMESPGGWNIIGNTPISFFDASKSTPCFAKPGDRITFYAVSLKTYYNTKALVDAGVYQMESEVLHD